MNRRAFLSAITAFSAAAAFDPERLLWTKTKTIFVPPAPKVQSAAFLMPRDFSVGDMLTISGRYARNPVTLEFTGHLQYFVVTAVTTIGPILKPVPLF